MMSLSETRICARYPFDMASARITSRCVRPFPSLKGWKKFSASRILASEQIIHAFVYHQWNTLKSVVYINLQAVLIHVDVHYFWLS